MATIRNRAIEMAKGDYIIQIDGDVILYRVFYCRSFGIGKGILCLRKQGVAAGRDY